MREELEEKGYTYVIIESRALWDRLREYLARDVDFYRAVLLTLITFADGGTITIAHPFNAPVVVMKKHDARKLGLDSTGRRCSLQVAEAELSRAEEITTAFRIQTLQSGRADEVLIMPLSMLLGAVKNPQKVREIKNRRKNVRRTPP